MGPSFTFLAKICWTGDYLILLLHLCQFKSSNYNELGFEAILCAYDCVFFHFKGDSIHWQRPGKLQEAEAFSYQPRAPSAEVEMTSYMLLAHLTAQPTPSSEDLSVASRIVKWIAKQQNPTGSFSSTQVCGETLGRKTNIRIYTET